MWLATTSSRAWSRPFKCIHEGRRFSNPLVSVEGTEANLNTIQWTNPDKRPYWWESRMPFSTVFASSDFTSEGKDCLSSTASVCLACLYNPVFCSFWHLSTHLPFLSLEERHGLSMNLPLGNVLYQWNNTHLGGFLVLLINVWSRWDFRFSTFGCYKWIHFIRTSFQLSLGSWGGYVHSEVLPDRIYRAVAWFHIPVRRVWGVRLQTLASSTHCCLSHPTGREVFVF